MNTNNAKRIWSKLRRNSICISPCEANLYFGELFVAANLEWLQLKDRKKIYIYS